jgi:hypothetical protein
MSDDQGPSEPANRAPPRARRHPVAIALMVFFGIILLLPGACALYFMSMLSGSFGSGADAVFWIVFWVVCLAISAWGVGLLVTAFR